LAVALDKAVAPVDLLVLHKYLIQLHRQVEQVPAVVLVVKEAVAQRVPVVLTLELPVVQEVQV